MDFKYTTTFSSIIRPVVSEEKDKFLALASMVEVGKYIPNIDTTKNVDLLPIAFNACVANRVNKNDDAIDTATAIRICPLFINKPIDLEHNRDRIIGVILTAGFSEFGTDKPLSEAEIKGTNNPFNITLGGVIWRIANPRLAEFIEESGDPTSDNYRQISASWELGFSDYDIIYLAPGQKNTANASLIGAPHDIEKVRSNLRSNKGDGHYDDKRIYRMLNKDTFPMGVGLTEKPAADVKGVATPLTPEPAAPKPKETYVIKKQPLTEDTKDTQLPSNPGYNSDSATKPNVNNVDITSNDQVKNDNPQALSPQMITSTNGIKFGTCPHCAASNTNGSEKYQNGLIRCGNCRKVGTDAQWKGQAKAGKTPKIQNNFNGGTNPATQGAPTPPPGTNPIKDSNVPIKDPRVSVWQAGWYKDNNKKNIYVAGEVLEAQIQEEMVFLQHLAEQLDAGEISRQEYEEQAGCNILSNAVLAMTESLATFQANNSKNISQSTNSVVNLGKETMKINSLSDITDENLKQAVASQEAVAATIAGLISAELKKQGEGWAPQKQELEAKVAAANAETAKVQEQLTKVQASVDVLNKEKSDREAVELFNNRMNKVVASYDLDEEATKLVTEEIKAIASDEDFGKWEKKAAVLLKGFAKKAKADDDAEAKKKDDKKADDKKADDKSDAAKKDDKKDDKKADDKKDDSKEAKASVVDSAVDNADKQKGGLPNSSSTGETLREKFKNAFASDMFIVRK